MSKKTKTCPNCKQEKPATLRHFNVDRRTFDGLTKKCVGCIGKVKPRAHTVKGYPKKYKNFKRWYDKNKEAVAQVCNRIVRT